MSKQTPGPWWVGNDGSIYADGAPVLTSCADVDGHYLSASDADRRLASAAPDLLHALEGALPAMRNWPSTFGHCIAFAEAAIAKARGEP